jgi:hypothetical protein
LLNKAGPILYHYIKRASASYIIPNTITTLNTYAFNNCTGLTSVNIPNSVTSISYNAFYNWKKSESRAIVLSIMAKFVLINLRLLFKFIDNGKTNFK